MGKTAYISDNKSALLAASHIPLCRMLLGLNQGLINYIDNKAKCRHLKKLTCKGTLRQVFIRVYRLEIQSIMVVFVTLFVNCCHSSHLSGSTSPPFLCE
jgi:hypothetical protein